MKQPPESNQNKINIQNLPRITVGMIGIVFGLILFWAWTQQANKDKAITQCISSSSQSPILRSDSPVNTETINQLKKDICENLIVKYESSSNLNWYWNLLILFSSVGATLALAVADNTKLRALLGCFATALVSIRSVIPVAQWSAFHQSLAGEGRALLIRLKYTNSINKLDEFEEIVKAYERAILRASTDQPTVNPIITPTPDSNNSPNSEIIPKS